MDKTWHLAENDIELEITDFELHLWRVFHGFLRWQERCEQSVNKTDLSGNELAVLHIIRMQDKPKTISDVSRLLNRDDTFNIHYSIRKLTKLGLIEKTTIKNAGKKNAAYQTTQKGIKNTDAYRIARQETLLEMFKKEINLDMKNTVHILSKIKAIYDEADRAISFYSVNKETKKNNQST